MSRQIIIGFTTEGPTDIKFLKDIIRRTFNEVAFECSTALEILDVIEIPKEKGHPYSEEVLISSEKAYKAGVEIFCVHVDADDSTDRNVFDGKINPAFSYIQERDEGVCKCLVPLVPVVMTEAWMLADKELLKKQIGTNLADSSLGLNRRAEEFSDPKKAISDAIGIARASLSCRHRKDLSIAQLYISMGEGIELSMLSCLSSYLKFQEAVRNAFRSLKLLH